jgi:hypothetical protein
MELIHTVAHIKYSCESTIRGADEVLAHPWFFCGVMRLVGTILNGLLQWGHAVLAAAEIQSAFNLPLPSFGVTGIRLAEYGQVACVLAGLPTPPFAAVLRSAVSRPKGKNRPQSRLTANQPPVSALPSSL